MRRLVIVTLGCLAAAIATAQAVDPLPAKLSGRWTFMGGGQVYIDTLSLVFDANSQPGAVSGRVTWRGINCGAKDEPFKGTWDGSELRIETMHRPNVNTQRMGGQCGTERAIYVLKRKPGDKTFEGEARLEGTSAVATMSVGP